MGNGVEKMQDKRETEMSKAVDIDGRKLKEWELMLSQCRIKEKQEMNKAVNKDERKLKGMGKEFKLWKEN